MVFRIISDHVIYFSVHRRIFVAKANLRDGCQDNVMTLGGEVEKRRLEGIKDNAKNSIKDPFPSPVFRQECH